MSTAKAIAHSKPIPALYTVYILRSTVRHASLYIGSTPNPPRRLSQHNGVARGGAARTSRSSLRPWEMVGLVSGFPSMVAALKFEWALANPHLSLHIPAESRISKSTQVKRNGHPRRPPMSLTSIVSNLHLLLDVPSFSRWPLTLHFFASEFHAAWEKWCKTTEKPLRKTLPVVTDFVSGKAAKQAPPPVEDEDVEDSTEKPAARGIHALPLDYAPIKDYVAKGQSVFEFEQEGNCIICHEPIVPGKGLHVLCTSDGCEGVGHLSCWSQHLLPANKRHGDSGDILPVEGTCPECYGEVNWGLMMKELTLRTRGKKDVEKLLKEKKKRAPKSKVSEEE